MNNHQVFSVARFQVPELHDGHMALLKAAISISKTPPVFFLGVSPTRGTQRNPIPYEFRRSLLVNIFGSKISVLPLPDMSSDEAWSQNLDRQIDLLRIPGLVPLLMTGPDSFLERYSGKYRERVKKIDEKEGCAGKKTRADICCSLEKYVGMDFRAGLIYQAYSRFPTVISTVDVAILKECSSEILLGRKSNESFWRFPGGFADPSNDCLEDDAKREVLEETGNEVHSIRYLFSKNIKDWRYVGEQDVIRTHMFVCTYMFGPSRAGDDLEEVKWFRTSTLKESNFVNGHVPLFQKLKESMPEVAWFNEK